MSANWSLFKKFGSVANFKQYFDKEMGNYLLKENSACCGLIRTRIPFVDTAGNPVHTQYPFVMFGQLVSNDKKFSEVLEMQLGVGHLTYRYNASLAIVIQSRNKAGSSLPATITIT
jgi:hypothetical protein